MKPAPSLTRHYSCLRTPKPIDTRVSYGGYAIVKGFVSGNLVGAAGCPGNEGLLITAGGRKASCNQCYAEMNSCTGGNDDGNRGAGRKRGVSGGGDNSDEQNNLTGGSSGDFGNTIWYCSRPALLGTLAILTASAAFPSQSRATPGFLFTSSNDSSSKVSLLRSSAPAHGIGGLSDSLDRAALERASLGNSGSSSTSTSPSRPRSKVMHVSCRGSTLVVPLNGNDLKQVDIPLARTLLPWQRKRIVEAPIELSKVEARMLASRQNRVRDSLLVQ